MISPLLSDLRGSLCPEDAYVCRLCLTLTCLPLNEALSLPGAVVSHSVTVVVRSSNMEMLLKMRSSLRPWIVAWKQQYRCVQSLLSYGCSACSRARRSLSVLFSRSASGCSPRPEARDDERRTSGMLTDQMSVQRVQV